MVGLYATTIENRLLKTQSREQLVLRFQAHPTLLGTPLEALAGVSSDGRVTWLNEAAARFLGALPANENARAIEQVFGHGLASLLRRGRSDTALALRLPSGLGVWLQAALPSTDGADFRHAVVVGHGPAAAAADLAVPTLADAVEQQPAAASPVAAAQTLRAHDRRLIEATLDAQGGNISQAARQLGVSRGTLYRQLRRTTDPKRPASGA